MGILAAGVARPSKVDSMLVQSGYTEYKSHDKLEIETNSAYTTVRIVLRSCLFLHAV